MHVVLTKGSWAVQETVLGTGTVQHSIKTAVETILKQHPSIVGPTTTVAVCADDGSDPSTYPLSAFTGGGFPAAPATESAVIEEPTPLHQETGEAGA